jgi:phosphoserine phosphatase
VEKQIQKLHQKLEEIKRKKKILDNYAHEYIIKRDNLNMEFKKIKSEANNLREKRNKLNAEIQSIKNVCEEMKSNRLKKMDLLNSLKRKMNIANLKVPMRSYFSLNDEVEKIDWKIQTESHSLTEERKLIDQIKTLKLELKIYQNIYSLKDKLAKLENEITDLKKGIFHHKEKIVKLAEKSQIVHKKMIDKFRESRELKVKADEAHQKYIKYYAEAKILHSEYVESLAQFNSLYRDIKESEKKSKEKEKIALLKQFEVEALNKLNRGEKISFEEFKLLAERKKI